MGDDVLLTLLHVFSCRLSNAKRQRGDAERLRQMNDEAAALKEEEDLH